MRKKNIFLTSRRQTGGSQIVLSILYCKIFSRSQSKRLLDDVRILFFSKQTNIMKMFLKAIWYALRSFLRCVWCWVEVCLVYFSIVWCEKKLIFKSSDNWGPHIAPLQKRTRKYLVIYV